FFGTTNMYAQLNHTPYEYYLSKHAKSKAPLANKSDIGLGEILDCPDR
ncbi:unnamed protein product, partial [Heterotrigona itama]